MSARNIQSDTSRVVVKNPLLSAVAGSIDDFVNNSILLPAAAPVVIATPPPSLPHLHENRDLKDNRGKCNPHSIWLYSNVPVFFLHKFADPIRLGFILA